ncbi:MAG: sensor domain-containing diguanylate cyclase [Planctomycetaceae bacterium]|nr:sensor domain-containing diguanylate cyclase [Planctomycetaceae bacterium]
MLEQLASAAHSLGAVTALGLICLVQYLWHVVSQLRLRRERDELQWMLADLEQQVSVVQGESYGVQLENRLLCDLISQPEADQAIRQLLQAFVPLESTGFSALFTRDDGWRLRAAVGLPLDEASALSIDPRLAAELGHVSCLAIDRQRLNLADGAESAAAVLAGIDGPIYALRTTPLGERLDGIVISSSLPETGGTIAERIRVSERLLAVAARYFRQTAVAEAQEQELRMTREILELRSVVDLEFRSPQEMVEQFLERLANVCEFQSAAVYLLRRKDRALTKLAQYATLVGRGSDDDWQSMERLLAQGALGDTGLRVHSPPSSTSAERSGPIRCAVTVPMHFGNEVVGVLALCGTSPLVIGEADRELLLWSSDYLLETILKTVDRASIEARASRDALTGLANRHTFDATLVDCVERATRSGRECALLMLDLDHFKRINDRYGHTAGDEALRTVSRLILDELRQHVRGTDHPIAARYGGEELAVILPGVGCAGGLRVAEGIRRRVETTPVSAAGTEFQVSLSAGIAVVPAQARSPEELLECADAALYEAKSAGRNRVVAAIHGAAASGNIRFIAP